MRKGVNFMNKRVLSIAALLILVFTMNIQTADARVPTARPSLQFDGTTAICTALCRGDYTDDQIRATLTLYQGTTRIDSWSGSGTWSATVSGRCKVQKGKTYKLVLTYSINSVTKPSVTVTNTCS